MDLLEKITEEVDEVININYIRNIIKERNLKIYWGTTPGRIPNINYLIPLMTIYHFIKNKCEIKILLADIHAFLDSVKSDFNVLKARTNVHEKIIKMLLDMLTIDYSDIQFVQGTSYQLSQEFTLDLYKINSYCSVSQVKNAGKEVVKQNNDPKMTSLLYPTLQALDIEYMECDVFFGDTKQKNICNLTNDVLKKLGYQEKSFFLNELYENLNVFNSITFLDTYDEIKNKIDMIKINILIEFIDVIVFDLCKIMNSMFTINDIVIKNLNDIKIKYDTKEIKNNHIRESIVDFINNINTPIREEYSHQDSVNILLEALYIK